MCDDKSVIEGLEKWAKQEALKNRPYTDGMFSHKKDYFTVVSDELRKSKPSPALLETLATIFENVDHELHSCGKTAARNRLSQEFGLVGNNTVQKDKIMNLAMDRKTDKEITDYLHCNKNTVSRALGTQKEPKEGTPRHAREWLLNPKYVDIKYPPELNTYRAIESAKKLLDKTTITILYFLNASIDGESCDVLTGKVTAYLISESPYDSYSKLVGDKKIRDHVTDSLSWSIKNNLIGISVNKIYSITEKGLMKLEEDVLKSLPCLKKHIQSHILPAFNSALEKGVIRLSDRNRMYRITEKG